LKLLEENIRKILEDIGIDNDFLNRTPIAQEIRARIDKGDFLLIKENNYQNEQTADTMGEDFCQTRD
jgi:hypothetical protein